MISECLNKNDIYFDGCSSLCQSTKPKAEKPMVNDDHDNEKVPPSSVEMKRRSIIKQQVNHKNQLKAILRKMEGVHEVMEGITKTAVLLACADFEMQGPH